MKLSLRRIVLFTPNMAAMTNFYRDVLDLPLRLDEPRWKEFAAGACVIALHNGTSRIGARPPKLGFWAPDIHAARAALLSRGVKMSKVMEGGGLTRCEGHDPDGNPFSVSDRE